MDKETKIIITIITAIVVAVIAYGLLQPYFEMKTFNRFSDKKATYLDATFSNLRIITKDK